MLEERIVSNHIRVKAVKRQGSAWGLWGYGFAELQPVGLVASAFHLGSQALLLVIPASRRDGAYPN